MSGAVMNYDFGPKRHWRRWVWNRIADKVASPRDAVVLYLAGAADNDRPLAKARGFRDDNLIAIEKNQTALRSLRADGVLTVGADFFRAVDAMAISSIASNGIQVVSADLCGGLSVPIFNGLLKWTCYPCMQHCVFVVNLLRGRDAQVNPIRELITDEFGKHRGMILLHWVFCKLASHGEDIEALKNGATVSDKTHWRYRELVRRASAAYTTYRSTANQTFDTVVFRNPLSDLSPGAVQIDLPDAMRRSGFAAQPDFIKARRAVAAVLAHRTRRLNAT